jgi:signal transduction histidine kinase
MRIFENYFYLRNVASRKNFLFILFFILVLNIAKAQNVDSLEAVLNKSLPDSSRITSLLELGRHYEYVDVIKSRKYKEEALKIAEENSLQNLMADAYIGMGAVYRVSGDYHSALRQDTRAFEISVMLQDTGRISTSANNVGNDYYDLGEYDEAYHFFLTSHRYSIRRSDSLNKAITLHNIGRVFKSLGELNKARNYLNTSRALSININDEEGEAFYHFELGDVLYLEQKYDSAFNSFLKTITICRKLGLVELQPRAMIFISKILTSKNDFSKALAYLDSADAMYEKNRDSFGKAEVNLGRGLTYVSMKKYDEALNYVNKTLEQAKQLNARILELECFHQLSFIVEQHGNYKKSLEYFRAYAQIKDSLFSQDTQRKLLRDQVQFETEIKDFQIATLNEQQALQKSAIKKQEFVRNILVVVMALSGILLVTVYRSGQRRRKINTLLLQHQEEMEKRSEELEKLNQVKDKFFSIISHDLRSPINALAGILDLLDKGAIEASELPIHIKELRGRFHHTRTLLNNLLDWTLLQMDKLNLQAAKIDIHKLVDENIELLASLQGKEINIINEVPEPAIAFVDSNTINLVIRNLLTNAIKFTNDGGKVLVQGFDKASEWVITVKDTGIGMKPEVIKILFDKTAPYTTRGTANEKGTGLGLILCKEFVEKNGGKIWVESKEGEGSTFFFTLPKEAI